MAHAGLLVHFSVFVLHGLFDLENVDLVPRAPRIGQSLVRCFGVACELQIFDSSGRCLL